MKILNIRIKNLNSLKGEFFIDFEASPLRESGLFLITGNTGAGKSTILDAITLALFGMVPRFEDMNINKKETQVLTHGTDDCYAEVEFKSLEKIYRSKWSLKKTRTGSFADSKREIAVLSPDRTESELLATKKKEVDQLIEELLGGLDFKRFTRSVLLAQGEFAQFLKGTKDRSTILERITNSDRYSKISMAAFERHKESLLELDRLKEQSANVQLLSSDEKETLQTQLDENELSLKEQEKMLNHQQKQLQLLEKLEQLDAQKLELENLALNLKEEQNKAQTDFDKLAIHQQAKEFRPALDELEQLYENLALVEQEIVALEQSAELAKTQLVQLKKTEAELDKTVLDSKKDYLAFEKIYDAVAKLDTQIESEDKLEKSLSKELETLVQIASSKTKTIEEATQKKETLFQQQKETNSWLEKHQIYASLVGSDNLFELKNKYKDLQKFQGELNTATKKHTESDKKITELQGLALKLDKKLQENSKHLNSQKTNYVELCEKYNLDKKLSHKKHLEYLQDIHNQSDLLLQELKKIDEEQRKQQELFEQIIQIDDDIESKQIELENWDMDFLKEEDILSNIRKQEVYYEMVYNEQKEKNGLSAYRGKLKEGEECPLCFSKDQPFRKMDVDINYILKKADQDLQETKKKRAAIEKKHLEIISEQRVLFVGVQDLQKTKAEVLKRLNQIEENIRSIIENKTINIAPLVYQKDALKKKIEDTAALLKEYLLVERSLQTVHQSIESSQKDDENIQTQLQQNALHLKDFRQQFSEYALEVTHYTDKIKTTQLEIEEVLANYQLEDDLPNAIAHLEKYRDYFIEQLELQQKQTSQLGNLDLQLKNATEQVQEAQENVLEKEKVWKKQQTVLNKIKEQRLELFGEASIQIAKEEKTKALEALEKQLETCLKQTQELENQQATSTGVLQEKGKQVNQFKKLIDKNNPVLLQNIQKIGLETLDQLKASILDKETALAIAEQEQQLIQQITTTSEKLSQNKKVGEETLLELKSFQEAEQKDEVLDKESLELAHQALQKQVKELLQHIGSTKEKLRHQLLQEEKHQSLLALINQHKKEVARWAVLKEVIGSSDGKKFRVFAQSITLKKLIYLANQHLRYFINGRYHLEKRFGEYQDNRPNDILEIDIVDTFQANNKRPLNTLSGGESFLASLALALGLSDLAGGKATIESLFIDEGFGTLDSDTMQVAIRALQTLQSKGKTIGVISHIEQLKQNISTQIHVVKKGGGFSQMKVEEV